MSKNKFLISLLLLNILYCSLTQTTFQESVCKATSCPSKTACGCFKKNTKCNFKLGCEKFFVSHRPSETVLFVKKNFLRTERLGHVTHSYTSGDSGDTARIRTVWISEGWRRKGLGSILMQHALNEMDKARVPEVRLAVGDWNKPAISLYKKCGFLNHKKLDGGCVMLRTLPNEINNL